MYIIASLGQENQYFDSLRAMIDTNKALNTLGSRIRQRRLELGYSQRALSKLVETSPGTISFWENDTATPRSITKVANALRTSVTWLEMGTGDPNSRTVTIEPTGEIVAEEIVPARKLPLLTAHQIARWVNGDDIAKEDAKLKYVYTEMNDLGSRSFAFAIPDQSMAPEVEKGDIVIADTTAKPEPGCWVVVRGERITDAALRVRRAKGFDDEGKEIFGVDTLNPNFPPMMLISDPIIHIGVAVELRKKLKP